MELREISVAALAYLGDSVIELCVRRHLVERGLSTSAHLNEAALSFVRAGAQAEAMKRLIPHLSEEEDRYFRRGRNMGHSSVPKRATVSEYRAATGWEAVLGMLTYTEQYDRAEALLALALTEQEKTNDSED